MSNELSRTSTRADGHYRAFTAQERTNGRRSRSRRNSRFSAEDFALIAAKEPQGKASHTVPVVTESQWPMASAGWLI